MCRIAGIYDPSNKQLEHSIVLMRDSMRHGGPDGEGIYLDEKFPLALGHRRLALIDLSEAGKQPMSDLDDNVQMVFNGEIYNFKEVRQTLEGLGYQFTSQTDTEVIIYAYLHWGTGCFARFNGMFALAIFDKRTSQVILARDHAGIKPLYYHLSKDKLIFASEIRAFKAFDSSWEEQENWRIAFLTFGHLPEPFTTLKDVQPLEKGTCAIIQLPTLDISIHHFQIFKFSNLISDLDEAVQLVKEKLENSVERHLISDAPIGLFLSGGVDSSLLTLLANRHIGNNLKTLSIVFEDATLNEGPYQQMIADKTNAKHHSFLVTEKMFVEALPDILLAIDQPSTDGINSYFICKYAKEYGLTAVLSGLGADELFGGYSSFNRTGASRLIQSLPSFIPGMASYLPSDKYKKISFLKRKDLTGEYLFNRGFYSPLQVAQLLDTSIHVVHKVLNTVRITQLPTDTDVRNKVSWLETNFYMQNQLLKDTDYMSMWHSLEVRVPFLDKELMEVAYAIAPQIKYNTAIGKYLLIKAFNNILPKEIWQRKKMGFTFPFYKWMKEVYLIDSTDKNLGSIELQYRSNKMSWSKYWAYLISKTSPAIRSSYTYTALEE